MIIKNNSKFRLIEGNSDDVVKNLKSGVYTLEEVESMFSTSIFIEPVGDKYTKGVKINEGIFKTINEDIDSFLSEEMQMARQALGMMNKCGIMFNGAPGAGKTFLAGQIGQKLVEEKDAICLITTDSDIDFAGIIDIIRQENPDKFIVLIIDEFEKTFYNNNTKLLSFLDGTDSRENTMIIATVNDTSKLPDYVTERPGRFEKIYTFKMDDESVLKPIVMSVLPEKYKKVLSDEIGKLMENIKKEANITIDSIRMHIRNLIYMHLKLVV